MRCTENGYASVWTAFTIALTAVSSFRAAAPPATVLEVVRRASLRVSEVVKLASSDIRWRDGILEVHGGKGTKDRNVPVDQEAVGWLRACSAIRSISCHQGRISRLLERRRAVVETGLAGALAVQ